MSCDLVLWRSRSDCEESAGLTYLVVEAGHSCPWLVPLPWEELKAELDGRFPPHGEERAVLIEGNRCCLFLSVAWSAVEEVSGDIEAFSRSRQLTLYDPQREPPSDADHEAFLRFVEAVLAEIASAEVKLLVRDAKGGDAQAMLDVGNAFDSGEGVERDARQAAHWYRRAADAGHVGGLLNLAECYRRGQGVRRDATHALQLLQRAVRTDELCAAFTLAEMHERGEGVERDLAAAERYYELARNAGHPEARLALARIRSER